MNGSYAANARAQCHLCGQSRQELMQMARLCPQVVMDGLLGRQPFQLAHSPLG